MMSCQDFSLISLKRNCEASGNYEAVFYPPKLVLIEAKRLLRIINIENVQKDPEIVLNVECDITDYFLQQQFLWFILETGSLFVYDLNEDLHLKIEIDNKFAYNAMKFKTDGLNFFLMSESEELFCAPYSAKELQMKLKEGNQTISISLSKSYTSRRQLYPSGLTTYNKNVHVKGLHLAIKQGTLIAECPLTGMSAVSAPTSQIMLEDIAPWENIIVIKGANHIWLIDITDGHTILNLYSDHSVYLLDQYKNDFYYIALDNTLVHVKYIQEVSNYFKNVTGNTNYTNEERQESQMQVLFKQEIKKLVTLILSTKNYNINNVFNELHSYFVKIDDFNFLLDIAISLCRNNFAYKTCLHFLQSKLEYIQDKNTEMKLQHAMIKVEIFEYIIRNNKIKYFEIDMFDYSYQNLCIMFISNADLDLATMTWLKWFKTQPILSCEDIEDLLQSVPSNIKINMLMVWFKAFIPSLIDISPFYIDLFIKWLTERVFAMETSTYWPKIAIKFIEEVSSILKDSHSEILVHPPAIDDLDVLRVHLFNIKELKEKYKINVLVGELSSQTPAEVVLIMLHRCYTEDLESLLSDYLPRYASRHSLELDNVLRSHVEREAARGGGAADDIRLAIFLAAFRSHTLRYECLLHVLKVLDVPWSTAVQEMAIKAATAHSDDFTLTKTDRILSRQIEIELNYAYYRIILKKYNFSEHCTDHVLILHKIVNCSSVNLSDLKTIKCVIRGFYGYGSILYVDRCLRDCKAKVALDYYNELYKREQKTLIKSVMRKLEFMFKDTLNSAVLERNYIDFLKGTSALSATEISDIEHLYHLKNSHKICIGINDMYHEKRCKNIFSDLNYIPNMQTKLCLSNIKSTFSFGIADDMETVKYLSLCSNKETRSMIQKIITEYFTNKERQMSCLQSFKDNQNTHLLLDCCKILVQIIFKCKDEYIHHFLKIFSVLNSLINTNLIIKNLMVVWKYNYIYIPISAISSTDDLINFYETKENGIEASLLTIFEMKSDFVYFRILSGIVHNYLIQNSSFDCTFIEARGKIVKKLLSKILVYQECDEILLMTLLLMIVVEENTDTEIYLTNSTLASALGIQGETLCSALTAYLCKPSVLNAFGISDTLSKSTNMTPYCMLKSKYNINVSNLPLPDFEETWDVRRVLFYVLNSNPNTCLESLIDLCRIINVTIDDGLYLQIVTILTTWELEYKVYFDDLNRKQITFLNDEKSLYSRCLPLWESIRNKKTAIDVLKELWKNGEYFLHGQLVSVNPYYYEVYITIYNLLSSVLSDWQTIKESYLLYFLQQYRRTGSPKQYEFEFFSVKGIFPEIGQYRLPFQLFMQDDMWTNLKSEITLETYEQWLPAVKLLALDADEQTAWDIMCSNALKQTMTNRKQTNEAETDKSGSEPWRLEAREESLLRAAHRCVRHIANMEWAGACLFYVLQGCARGADQVAAAQLCYNFAQRWAAIHPLSRAVQKMQRLYSTLSTRHALHKVDWACDELLRQVAEPAQLVRTLYLHPSFIEKMAFYDINSTANEIAEKNGINISSIRIQLLENILEHNEISKTKTSTSGLDMTELMRAKYVLKATCPKMGAIYLARIALDEETDLNKRKKMRALQCLISIADPDTVVKVTNRERESLWQSLLELYYAIQLESTGMPWAGAALASDKTRVLEQLVIAASTGLDHLRLCVQLTRRYGNAALARRLLTLLIRAALLDDLASLLVKYNVTGKNSREAWRTVLIGPFQRADYPITDKQRSYCLKAINMLMLYEDITDEDLKVIWKNCIRCKCYALGCLVLPFMSVENRKTLTELEKIDKRDIIAGIKNLHNETCLVNSAMFIIEKLLLKQKC